MNIVLMHGVLGFGRRFGVDYFKGPAKQFDLECADIIKSVRYFDVAGVGRKGLLPTSAPFMPLHAIVAHAATTRGEDARNDGVVPFLSAARNRTPAAIWQADHADMVGHDLNRGPDGPPQINYLAAYEFFVTKFILGKSVSPPVGSGLV